MRDYHRGKTIDEFYIDNDVVEQIQKIDPTFRLSEEALKCLSEKYEKYLKWFGKRYNSHRNNQYIELDISSYYSDDASYCGACMESPCLCSDPDRTSITYNGW